MAQIFKEPQIPLQKIDEDTGNTYYIYPQTTDKQVIMENGKRLNTILNENILYLGDTENGGTNAINADTLGGSNKDYFATASSVASLQTSVNTLNTAINGLKFRPITEAEYKALATKDSSTLYIFVG